MSIPAYQKKHFPKLNDRNGDLEKRWYISFYMWDSFLEKFVRKTDFSMNHLKTLKERRSYCKELMNQIASMMLKGAVTNVPQKEPKKYLKWKDAYRIVYEYKKYTISANTLRWYVTLDNAMGEFLRAKNFENLDIENFEQKTVYQFLDFLKVENKISNKTYNNYLTTLHTFFEVLTDREYIKLNPCKKIQKIGVQSGNHTPYTNEQIGEIKRVIEEKGFDRLLLFVQFIYYTLARPRELKALRVGDIGEKTIMFKGKISKNKKTQFVMIPDALEILIEAYQLRSQPKDFFVFGKNGFPSAESIVRDYFYEQFVVVLKELNLRKKGYTIYSFKHTAVINLYNAGVDIKDIQAQCRHSSIAQTDVYLKDLGLIKNDTLKSNYPAF